MATAYSTTTFGQTFPEVEKLPIVAELPDPLTMFGGGKVASRDEWFAKRRPELLALFSHYMYGSTPPAPEKIDAKVSAIDRAYFAGAATRKLVTIKLGPAGAPALNVLLVVPNKRSGPAPTFVGLNFCGNHALLRDPEIPLPTTWMPDNCQGCKGQPRDRGGPRDTDRRLGHRAVDRPRVRGRGVLYRRHRPRPTRFQRRRPPALPEAGPIEAGPA